MDYALGTGLYLPFSLLYFQKIAGLALPGPSWPWAALTGLSLVAGLIIILLESHLSVQAVHVHQ